MYLLLLKLWLCKFHLIKPPKGVCWLGRSNSIWRQFLLYIKSKLLLTSFIQNRNGQFPWDLMPSAGSWPKMWVLVQVIFWCSKKRLCWLFKNKYTILKTSLTFTTHQKLKTDKQLRVWEASSWSWTDLSMLYREQDYLLLFKTSFTGNRGRVNRERGRDTAGRKSLWDSSLTGTVWYQTYGQTGS